MRSAHQQAAGARTSPPLPLRVFSRKGGRHDRDHHRGPPPGTMGDSEGDAQGKLFIGGVSWQTTEVAARSPRRTSLSVVESDFAGRLFPQAGLRDHFGKYGELLDVALMRNKHTGQPRGFGFVKFKDAVCTSPPRSPASSPRRPHSRPHPHAPAPARQPRTRSWPRRTSSKAALWT